LKEDEPDDAFSEFKDVVEKDDGEWGFKATKQIIKLMFLQAQKKEALEYYVQFLGYIKSSSISRNYAEKSLNNIMEHVTTDDAEFMEKIYSSTLEVLDDPSTERLWIKTALRLATLYIEREEAGRAEQLLKRLHEKCAATDSDNSKGTYLLELYSLEIQLYTVTNNNKKLKELYNKTLSINTAIPHPRILGIIRECGGKMHMREHQWDAAREDFFESFKNYDEAGSLQRLKVLKCYVVACMLSESEINPFASQETKPYMNNPEINAMVQLVEAFHNSDVEEFNRLMKVHQAEIMSDKFLKQFLGNIVNTIQSLGLINMVKPYTRVSFQYLASNLQIDVPTLQNILTGIILDGKLPNGRLNLLDQVLEFNPDFQEIANQTKPIQVQKLPERYQQRKPEVVDIDPEQEKPRYERSNVLSEWLKSTHYLHSTIYSSAIKSKE
jgi:COP9 signalosome complex subunit 2